MEELLQRLAAALGPDGAALLNNNNNQPLNLGSIGLGNSLGAAAANINVQNENANGDDLDDEEIDDGYVSFVCPKDPKRMEITRPEHLRALIIKAAIQQSPDIDNLTDFECAQLALVDHNNIDKALERCRHFQTFRQEYNLQDTFEEGVQIIQSFMDMMPQFILCISLNIADGSYIWIIDLAGFDQSALKTKEHERLFMGGLYYMAHITSADLFAVRSGLYAVLECEGYDWRKVKMSTRRQGWQEVLAIYPHTFRQIKYFHPGLFTNLAVSCLRRIVPLEIFRKIEVGCEFPGGRLDSFYAQPTRQVANKRLMQRMRECLRVRFQHKENYKFPEL